MRLRQLTDTITQVTRMRVMNAYLVREDDGLTLIDTTASGGAPALLKAARSLNAPIRRIALTHGHGDHVGSLDALLSSLQGDVEVLMPERDARILAGDTSRDRDEFDGKPKGGWPKLTTTPDVLLEPGDRVGSLEVVASPGHTPGHVAFIDVRDRALICGDAFQTAGGTTVAGVMNWRFPLVAMATWDPDGALASAQALSALEPTLLAPGHGRGLPDPHSAIDRAIARGSARGTRESTAVRSASS